MLEILNKLFTIISRRQQKGFMSLIIFLFFGVFLEILALGVIVPSISSVIDPSFIQNDQKIGYLKSALDLNNESVIYYLLLIIIIVYFIKTSFFLYINFFQSKLVGNIIFSTSNHLFNNFINQPYKYHINKSSSEIIKIFQIEIHFFTTYLISLITLFVEASVITVIIILLLYVEFFGAVSIGLFFLSVSALYYFLTKGKLSKWGGKRESLDKVISKILTETFDGIKEVILLSRKNYFKSLFLNNNYLKKKYNIYLNTFVNSPRFLLEFITIIGLVFFLSILIYNNQNTTKIISTLGLFVAASFRIIPSLNRVISSLQQLHFYSPSINTIYQIFKEFNNSKNNFKFKELSFNSKIEFRKINKTYGEKNILSDINFTIYKGEKIGIIGKSGVGKSTLVDMLSGLISPSSGDIFVDGIKLSEFSRDDWLKNIGYVPQSFFLLNETVQNNIIITDFNHKNKNIKLENALKKSQSINFINELDKKINTKIGDNGIKLSGGQKQRLAIARALYIDPEILIFDESTSSLDNETESEILKSINNLNNRKTILIISHKMSSLKFCDKIYKIENTSLSEVKF